MKRLGVGAMLALLAANVAGAAEAAKDSAPAPVQAPWYTRWFGIGPEPPKPAPKPRNAAAEAAKDRAAAEANYDRRVRVCDELDQIAIDTKDAALAQRAQALREQAWELYKQQTAHLPCNRLLPSEERLERQLVPVPEPAKVTASKLAPWARTPERTGQANAFREVKP